MQSNGRALPFRVATYNVKYFSHPALGLGSLSFVMQRAAKALAQISADVVFLQEVEQSTVRSRWLFKGARKAPSGQQSTQNQVERLSDALATHLGPGRLESRYFPAHLARWKGISWYSTGLGILYNPKRFDAEYDNAEQPHEITDRHAAVPFPKQLKQSRVCAHLRLKDRSTGKTVDLFGTHLSLPTPMRVEFWLGRPRFGHVQNQLDEMAQLIDFIRGARAKEGAMVLAGDFNALPASPALGLLEESGLGLRRVRTEEGCSNYHSAAVLRWRIHLDHIWNTAHFDARSIWLGEGPRDPQHPFFGLSDHVPVLTELSWS